MAFPADRPRRLRRSESLRALVRETVLEPSDFMLPLFAVSGKGVRKPIGSMPGVAQLSVEGEQFVVEVQILEGSQRE